MGISHCPHGGLCERFEGLAVLVPDRERGLRRRRLSERRFQFATLIYMTRHTGIALVVDSERW